MSGHHFHRGVGFTVREVTAGRWHWAIFPPKAVKGFERKSGEVLGERTHAIEAAKIEIEAQDVSAATAIRSQPAAMSQ